MSGVEAIPFTLGALARLFGIDREPWHYALVSGLHILGFSLLVGGIVPVALAMMRRETVFPAKALRLLRQGAVSGLVLAIMTGIVLLGTRPDSYLTHPVVQIKLGLVFIGLLHALLFHLRKRPPSTNALAGAISLVLWLVVLGLGRAIGFAMQA